MRKIFSILILFFLLELPVLAEEQGAILLESLLARVGEETVQYTDLQRFKAVENIMHCVGIRIKPPQLENETLQRLLSRYVEEELIYVDAKSKSAANGSGKFEETIGKIKAFPICHKRWKSLGERYSQIWNSKSNNLAGEGMLVRELEKRLLIDNYVREKIGSDLKNWLQEAKLKVSVKYYLE